MDPGAGPPPPAGSADSASPGETEMVSVSDVGMNSAREEAHDSGPEERGAEHHGATVVPEGIAARTMLRVRGDSDGSLHGRHSLRASSFVKNEMSLFVFEEAFPMEEDDVLAIAGKLPEWKATTFPVERNNAAHFRPLDGDGVEPVGFNEKDYTAERNQRPRVEIVPMLFRFPTQPLPTLSTLPPEAKIESLPELHGCRNPAAVTYICIQQVVVSGSHQQVEFLRSLSRFQNLQVLLLQGIGLTTTNGLNVPTLRYLSLYGNDLRDSKGLLLALRRSPILSHLDLRDNPIGHSDSSMHKVLAENPGLRFLNGESIAVSQRVEAVRRAGTKPQKHDLPSLTFDWALGDVCSRLGMTEWNPFAITDLQLPDIGLSEFQVGALTLLERLNVSGNVITHLDGSGLEHLSHLTHLDCSNNKISDANQVEVLRYIPALLHVRFEGNKVDNHRLRVICATANLRGLDRMYGIITVDGIEVSIMERLRAYAVIAKVSERDLSALHAHYALVALYGHKRMLNDRASLGSVKRLILTEQGLTWFDLSIFKSIQVCDLSDNNLKSIAGLTKCSKLQYFDVSGNSQLNTPEVLGDLGSLHKLGHVILHQVIGDKAGWDNRYRASRQRAINALVSSNPKFACLDGVHVSIAERSEAFRSLGSSGYDLEIYRFHLAVTMQCLSLEERSHVLTDVVNSSRPSKGLQYTPTDVVILRLGGLELSESGIFLSEMVNLEMVDLSRNRIQDITGMGLEKLKKLQVLDLSYNNIRNDVSSVASVIDQLPALELLALHNNPRLSRFRTILIGSLQCLRAVTCNLRVLDTEILNSERVDAWKAAGVPRAEREKLKFAVTMHTRGPQDADPAVYNGSIDLSGADMEYVDLKQYSKIVSLDLSGNALSDLAGTGIESMKELRHLDLRNNKLQSLERTTELLQSLPRLESVGLIGNLFSRGSKYRPIFIGAFPLLADPACALRTLDDEVIDVDEIIKALKRHSKFRKGNPEQVRYNLAVARRVRPGQDPSAIDEIDLSGLRLTHVNLSKFLSVQKVNLADNRIKGRQLGRIGLEVLPSLRYVDLANNNIEKLESLATLCNKIQHVEGINVIGNPAYPREDRTLRLQFLSMLDQTRRLRANMKYLNGTEIGLDERGEALRMVLSGKELARLCFELVIEELSVSDDVEELDLSNRGLSDFSGLKRFSNLRRLNLSNNNIQFLSVQELHLLPKLKELDLSFNDIEESHEDVIDSLSKCAALTELKLDRCGVHFEDISDYGKKMFDNLRGIATLDGVQNPHPLDDIQKRAVKYFRERFSIGANGMTCVDLKEKNIEKSQFWAILLALQSMIITENRRNVEHKIGPRSLSLREGNFKEERIEEYRALLLYYIPTLEFLDGVAVSEDEKFNARETVDKQTNGQAAQLNMKNLEYGAKVKALAAGSAGSQANRIDFRYVETNPGAFPQLGNLQSGLSSDMAISFTGRLLSKVEILVHFLQTYALVFSINLDIWPDAFRDALKWIANINLSLELVFPDLDIDARYAKFAIAMAIPPILLVLMLWNIDKFKFKRRYDYDWKRTKSRWFRFWLLFVIVAPFAAIVADFDGFWDRVSEGWPFSGVGNGVLFTIIGVVTSIYVVLRLHAAFVRRKINSPNFEEFFNKVYNRLRQRVMIFFLSVSYIPVANVMLSNFRCLDCDETPNDPECPRDKGLYLWEGDPCISSLSDFQAIHWVSVGFFLLYVVGIPILFLVLIYHGTKEVELNYNIAFHQKEVKKLKEELKAKRAQRAPKDQLMELKKNIKKKEDFVFNKYSHGAHEHKKAQSYLYAPFEQSYKYYRPSQMLEKLILLCAALYVTSQLTKSSIGIAVVGLYFIVGLILRPFADWSEDVADLVSRFNIVFIAAVAVCTAADVTIDVPDWVPDIDVIMYIVSIACVSTVFLLILLNPIRSFVTKRRYKKAREREKAEKAKRIQETSLVRVNAQDEELPTEEAYIRKRADKVLSFSELLSKSHGGVAQICNVLMRQFDCLEHIMSDFLEANQNFDGRSIEVLIAGLRDSLSIRKETSYPGGLPKDAIEEDSGENDSIEKLVDNLDSRMKLGMGYDSLESLQDDLEVLIDEYLSHPLGPGQTSKAIDQTRRKLFAVVDIFANIVITDEIEREIAGLKAKLQQSSCSTTDKVTTFLRQCVDIGAVTQRAVSSDEYGLYDFNSMAERSTMIIDALEQLVDLCDEIFAFASIPKSGLEAEPFRDLRLKFGRLRNGVHRKRMAVYSVVLVYANKEFFMAEAMQAGLCLDRNRTEVLAAELTDILHDQANVKAHIFTQFMPVVADRILEAIDFLAVHRPDGESDGEGRSHGTSTASVLRGSGKFQIETPPLTEQGLVEVVHQCRSALEASLTEYLQSGTIPTSQQEDLQRFYKAVLEKADAFIRGTLKKAAMSGGLSMAVQFFQDVMVEHDVDDAQAVGVILQDDMQELIPALSVENFFRVCSSVFEVLSQSVAATATAPYFDVENIAAQILQSLKFLTGEPHAAVGATQALNAMVGSVRKAAALIKDSIEFRVVAAYGTTFVRDIQGACGNKLDQFAVNQIEETWRQAILSLREIYNTSAIEAFVKDVQEANTAFCRTIASSASLQVLNSKIDAALVVLFEGDNSTLHRPSTAGSMPLKAQEKTLQKELIRESVSASVKEICDMVGDSLRREQGRIFKKYAAETLTELQDAIGLNAVYQFVDALKALLDKRSLDLDLLSEATGSLLDTLPRLKAVHSADDLKSVESEIVTAIEEIDQRSPTEKKDTPDAGEKVPVKDEVREVFKPLHTGFEFQFGISGLAEAVHKRTQQFATTMHVPGAEDMLIRVDAATAELRTRLQSYLRDDSAEDKPAIVRTTLQQLLKFVGSSLDKVIAGDAKAQKRPRSAILLSKRSSKKALQRASSSSGIHTDAEPASPKSPASPGKSSSDRRRLFRRRGKEGKTTSSALNRGHSASDLKAPQKSLPILDMSKVTRSDSATSASTSPGTVREDYHEVVDGIETTFNDYIKGFAESMDADDTGLAAIISKYLLKIVVILREAVAKEEDEDESSSSDEEHKDADGSDAGGSSEDGGEEKPVLDVVVDAGPEEPVQDDVVETQENVDASQPAPHEAVEAQDVTDSHPQDDVVAFDNASDSPSGEGSEK